MKEYIMNTKIKTTLLISIILLIFSLITLDALFDKRTSTRHNTINIAFCIDNNYKKNLPIVIFSILKNNVSNSKYHFYIFTNNLSFKNKILTWLFIKNMGQKATIKKIDTTPIDNGRNYSKHPFYKYITRISAGRLIMVDYLPKDVSKILYLDSDIIAMKDLSIIYNTNLDNKVVAMAKNENISEEYYNAGVILIDVNKWKQANILAKIKNFDIKKCSIPDQDIINGLFFHQIQELPTNYNYFKRTPESYTSKQNIYIRHYIGPNKFYDDIANEYQKLFKKYLNHNFIANLIYKLI